MIRGVIAGAVIAGVAGLSSMVSATAASAADGRDLEPKSGVHIGHDQQVTREDTRCEVRGTEAYGLINAPLNLNFCDVNIPILSAGNSN